MKQLSILLIVLLSIVACEPRSGDEKYREAKGYYQEGDDEKAMSAFREAIKKPLVNYSEAEAYTYIGNIFCDRDQFDSSIIMYEKALKIDCVYVDALVNMGISYRLKGDFDKAEECYLKAMYIDPRDPELFTSLGALNIFQGELQSALSNLQQAIELNSQIPQAHANYSLTLAMKGDFVMAEKELRTAVSLGYKNEKEIRDRIERLKDLE